MKPLNRIIINILTFFLRIINLELINKWNNFKNRLYSEILRRSFHQCGNEFYISSPANIIGPSYITIGNNFYCFARLRLEAYDFNNGTKFNPKIVIGNNVTINYDCHIGCVNEINIGNNVLIASKVFITDHFHGDTSIESLEQSPGVRSILSKGKVITEDNVWIGEGVAIMPNVKIGKNSVIGANAVVTTSFPPYSIIAGVPARLIKSVKANHSK